MTEFQLESGDTGQALLPVPVSAIAERVKVKDEGASPDYNTAPEHTVRCALAYIAGFDPKLYERALRRARGDWS